MVTYAATRTNRITYISPQIEEWTGLPARCWTEDADALARDAAPRRPRARGHGGLRRRHARHRVPHARPRRTAGSGSGSIEVKVAGPGRQPGHLPRHHRAARGARGAARPRSAQLGAVVNAAPVILFATDADGIDHALGGQGAREPRAARPGEMVGTSIFEPSRGRCRRRDARRALAGESFDTLRRRSASASSTARGARSPTAAMIGIAIDVTARHRSEERLAHLAYHDPLTGLPNRATVEEQLGARPRPRAARGRRRSPCSTSTSTTSSSSTTRSATPPATRCCVEVARADPRRDPRRRPARPARRRRVRARLPRPRAAEPAPRPSPPRSSPRSTRRSRVDGAEFQLGASIGIALGPAHGARRRRAAQHADVAMYQAKRSGPQRLRALPRRRRGPPRQAHAHRAPAPRARRGRVRPALPAGPRPRDGPPARRRGARPLATTPPRV